MWFQFISSTCAALFLAAAAWLLAEPIVLIFLSVSCAAAYLSHSEDLPHSIRVTGFALAIGLYLVSLLYLLGGLL